MKVLSLFDGMACGMLAFMEVGVSVERYVAYEIDKYAIQTSTHNFPMIEHKGDVFKADFTEYKGFDFVIGGSPCTKWSIAQKKDREVEASGEGWDWFSQFTRAVKEAEPKYFIYENNKSMSKAIRKSIDETFGFEAVEINSKLVSAQNRQRLYWVGRRNADGTYSKVNVELPEDRGVLLKDVLDTVPVATTPDGKANVLTTVQKDNNVCEPVRIGCYPSPDGTLKNSQGMRIYSVDGKSVNLTALGGGMGAKTGLYAVTVGTEIIPFVEERFDKAVKKYGYIPQMWNPYNNAEITDKAPTQTAQCGSKGSSATVFVFDCAIACEWDKNGRPTKAISAADSKTYDVYEVKGGYITIKGKTYPIKLKDGYYIIRKLTVSERKRLQTVPEWYEFPVSNSQAYKMLGNGWTVDVIAHLIASAVKEKDNG